MRKHLKHALRTACLISGAWMAAAPQAGAQIQVLAAWKAFGFGSGANTAPNDLPPNSTFSADASALLSRGPAVAAFPVTTPPNNYGAYRYYGTPGATQPNTVQDLIDAGAFLYWKIQAQPGKMISLDTLRMLHRTASSGTSIPAAALVIQYGIDSASFTDLYSGTSELSTGSGVLKTTVLPLDGISALQNVGSSHTIYFRMIPVYSRSTSATGGYSLGAPDSSNVLELKGRSGPAVPLPVELLSFNGRRTAEGVQLRWETAQAGELQRFELERSADGLHFARIAILSAKEVAGAFEDRYAPAIAHYRLLLVALNGMSRYSSVLVFRAEGQKGGLKLYPNPATGSQLLVGTGADGKALLLVTDAAGREVYRAALEQQAGQLHTLPVGGWPRGLYFLHCEQGGQTKTQRFTLQ